MSSAASSAKEHKCLEGGMVDISVELIKELRDRTGVGIMECKSVLNECAGNIEQAVAKMKDRGVAIAEKKQGRVLGAGTIESYIHAGGRIGAMVELLCETDFVARTPEFKELSHNLAMQVAATDPDYLSQDDAPEAAGSDVARDSSEACLLLQPFIKQPDKTVHDMIVEVIAKVGENVRLNKYCRFELGG